MGYCFSEKLSSGYVTEVFSGPGPEVLWTWYQENKDRWTDSGADGILSNKTEMVNKLPQLRKFI